METSEIPNAAWVVFGVVWVAGLALFGCLYLIIKKLGMSWVRRGAGMTLDQADAKRLGRIVLGREDAGDAKQLVWAVRGLWLVQVVGILGFVAIMMGAV